MLGTKTSPIIRENISAVASIEQQFLDSRSTLDRVVDSVATFTGSLTFVLLHLVGFAIWGLINFGDIPGVAAFDPYPFALLSTAVSAEAVLLSTFVLMKQNRMARRADEREHLHLQINLLAEKEITKILQTLTSLCEHVGVKGTKSDPEMQELTKDTAVHDLAEELREQIGNVTE